MEAGGPQKGREATPRLGVATPPRRSISESWGAPEPRRIPWVRASTSSLHLSPRLSSPVWTFRDRPGPGCQRPLLFLWQRGGFQSSTTADRDLLRNLGARRNSRWASVNVSVSSFFHCTNSGSLSHCKTNCFPPFILNKMHFLSLI